VVPYVTQQNLSLEMTEYETGHLESSLQPITCTGTTFTEEKKKPNHLFSATCHVHGAD